MAELNCVATNCFYNEECMCSKGEVTVSGNHACCGEDTCCESFAKKGENAYRSALDHPSTTISIDCEAIHCIYNQDYKCAAEHVDIMGQRANNAGETACATFQEKR